MRLSIVLFIASVIPFGLAGDGPPIEGAGDGAKEETGAMGFTTSPVEGPTPVLTTPESPIPPTPPPATSTGGKAEETKTPTGSSIAVEAPPATSTGSSTGSSGGKDESTTNNAGSSEEKVEVGDPATHPQGEEGKSDGEGGEGTTPIDQFVLIPLYLLAGGAIILFGFRRHDQFSKDKRGQRSFLRSASQSHTPKSPWFKWMRLRYAPLYTKRHSLELRPFKWLNFGVLPTRVEASIMLVYTLLNVIFTVATIPWSSEEWSLKMYGLRNHSGTLATANLIPLVLTAGRNNPLVPFLKIPFNTFNTMHRFLGRLVVVETLLHVAAVLATKVPTSGWSIVPQELWGKTLVLYGFISSIMFIVIIMQAWRPLRSVFYESFLVIHILLSIGAFVTLWYHLETLQHQRLMIGVFIAWAFERIARIVLTVWRNSGSRPTRATMELLSHDLVRISLRVARPWNIRPGQHLYLYIPSVGLWTSHPFSIAWVDEAEGNQNSRRLWDPDTLKNQKWRNIFLLVKAESGFTKSLVAKAAQSHSGKSSALALVEGTYGKSTLSGMLLLIDWH
ncbi:hypothetical protein ABW19_dt0201776 [Dactylella cylindrospora]|nr:hypothetical protein ABW19_dt0201776 [Dactylella cylindrospora]